MKISGLIKSSVIDFPGRITAVVFTQGCNFRCGFCHNPDLIDFKREGNVSEAEFFELLGKRKGILDGVVITGGEPTLQPDLITFLSKIKDMGYQVKLDTNGAKPEVLKEIFAKNLVDYVAMDIKNTLAKYEEISKAKVEDKIIESIKLIMNSNVEYEFRTTVLPRFHSVEDFGLIGEMIEGANLYTIQSFRPEITFDKSLREERRFSTEELNKIKNIISKYVKKIRVLENI